MDRYKIINATKSEVLNYMLKQNKDVDYQNIPENGFKTKKEVDDWWKSKDETMICKVYDEYYGSDTLIDVFGLKE